MAQRALVLGSQIDGLRGVGNDTQRMAAMLDARGFEVDLRVGGEATRAGMLAGYDRLIEASAPGDAAVVYYCGHGFHAQVPHEGRAWQCIAPTDLRAGTVTDWRGITAWELSIKQAQLTARTRNVTVILDCCHAAQLSRGDDDPGATPRALPHPVDRGFDHHLAVLRATYGAAFHAVDPLGNPDAVRLVACGQNEAAFEYQDAHGQHHGAFTDVLVDALTQLGSAPVSWASLIGSIRASVLRRFVRQRPALEGPAHRAPFSLAEHDDLRRVAVSAAGAHVELAIGRLTGAAVGDIYDVRPADALLDDDAPALARLEIIELSPTTARTRRIAGDDALPADARAVAVDRRAARWPVAIAGDSPARAALQRAIDASPTLRTAQPDDLTAIATVRLMNDDATIADPTGPLVPPARIPSELAAVLGHLANLGVAQGIRELEGEHGLRAGELTIELGVVRDGQRHPLPDHGARLALSDHYYLTLERSYDRPLFVHVLSINARGKITLLTHFAREGVPLGPRHPTVTLGQRADGALPGIALRWPDGLPRTPRLTELVVIATQGKTDLSGLETRELAIGRNDGNALQRMLGRLCDGVYRDMHGNNPLDAFYVKRLSFSLAPTTGRS